jgi:hypothetical protein
MRTDERTGVVFFCICFIACRQLSVFPLQTLEGSVLHCLFHVRVCSGSQQLTRNHLIYFVERDIKQHCVRVLRYLFRFLP